MKPGCSWVYLLLRNFGLPQPIGVVVDVLQVGIVVADVDPRQRNVDTVKLRLGPADNALLGIDRRVSEADDRNRLVGVRTGLRCGRVLGLEGEGKVSFQVFEESLLRWFVCAGSGSSLVSPNTILARSSGSSAESGLATRFVGCSISTGVSSAAASS